MDKLQQEDTVSADRKERIIFDPSTGKSRKVSSVVSRQNFNNAKYGNRNAPIQDVTGTEADVKKEQVELTAKDLAEEIVKKSLSRISIDKNLGVKEVPFDGPYTKTPDVVVDKSGAKHTPYSRVRNLARQALAKQAAVKEEVEQIDELNKTTLQSYKEKAAGDIVNAIDRTFKDKPRADKRMAGIKAANAQLLKKEETELEEGSSIWSIKNTKTGQVYKYSKYPIDKNNETLKKIHAAGGDHVHATPHKDGKPINEEALDEKAAEGFEGTVKAMKKHPEIDNPWALSHWMKKKGYKSHVKEEVELEEGYDKSSDFHKAARSMARSHGGKATFNADGSAHVRFNDTVTGRSTVNPSGTLLHTGSDMANRAVKDHGKGTVDGNTVHFKEEVELNEGKMGQIHADIEDHLGAHLDNYKKVGGAEHFGAQTVKTAKHIAKLHGIEEKHAQGLVNQYVDSKLQEETDMSDKLTYAQFVEQLLEYTPGPGGVTRVQGRSYGAQYHDPEGDDDADDKVKAPAAAPAVKRGRGRPAGSKSGANVKRLSSKGSNGYGYDSTGYKLHLPNSNK